MGCDRDPEDMPGPPFKLGPTTPFGKNLKKIRESIGLSQVELARRAGLTPAAISQIEGGSRDPGLTSIVQIMKVIPVSFEKLIGWED